MNAKNPSEQEKRRHSRLRVNLSVVYRVDKPVTIRMIVGTNDIRATMLDISEGGLSVLTNFNIPQGTVLLIKFTLFRVADDDVSFYGPMEIMGEVKYIMPLSPNEYRLGISFGKIKEQDRAEISAFIKSKPSA
jgi:c-di-GMP-binding flagellar brake protein YcgR